MHCLIVQTSETPSPSTRRTSNWSPPDQRRQSTLSSRPRKPSPLTTRIRFDDVDIPLADAVHVLGVLSNRKQKCLPDSSFWSCWWLCAPFSVPSTGTSTIRGSIQRDRVKSSTVAVCTRAAMARCPDRATTITVAVGAPPALTCFYFASRQTERKHCVVGDNYEIIAFVLTGGASWSTVCLARSAHCWRLSEYRICRQPNDNVQTKPTQVQWHYSNRRPLTCRSDLRWLPRGKQYILSLPMTAYLLLC